MLGLILWYFIGKYFYDLATVHNRNKWGYAVFGVFSYYLGPIIFGLSLGIYSGMNSEFDIDNLESLTLDLLSIPLGLLSCWITYVILKKRFEKKAIPVSNEMLDYEILSDHEGD